jgi:hypothetical protein
VETLEVEKQCTVKREWERMKDGVGDTVVLGRGVCRTIDEKREMERGRR